MLRSGRERQRGEKRKATEMKGQRERRQTIKIKPESSPQPAVPQDPRHRARVFQHTHAMLLVATGTDLDSSIIVLSRSE